MENKQNIPTDNHLNDEMDGLLSEQELDSLIFDAFERQDIVGGINKAVMHDIRRSVRRKWLRRWGRLAAFAFGVPLLLAVFLYFMIPFMLDSKDNHLVLACLCLPVITMFVGCWKVISDFSIDKV